MYDNDTSDVSELAKKMADRIGHGMSEKCMVHADVAVTEKEDFKKAIAFSMRLAAEMLGKVYSELGRGECPGGLFDFVHPGRGGCGSNCTGDDVDCWTAYLLEQGIEHVRLGDEE